MKPIPKSALIGDNNRFRGQLYTVKHLFPRVDQLRGTWDGGPHPIDIRRRVVIDAYSKRVLAEDTFLDYDDSFDWNTSVLNEQGQKMMTDIEVVLWYVARDPSRRFREPFWASTS